MARKKKKEKSQRTRAFGSPIELMLRNGIVSAAESNGITLYDHSVFVGSPFIENGDDAFAHAGVNPGGSGREQWGDPDGAAGSWSLFGGVLVESYRLDLCLELHDVGVIAVECDGHEFHERTKQQAAYDKSRDRDLLILGIPTLRFTGSEIHHSIERCVGSIYDVGHHLVSQGMHREERVFDAYHHGLSVGWRDAVIAYNKSVDPPADLDGEHW